MKTKNCENIRMVERDKALLDYFDEEFKVFNLERNKLPSEFQKSLSPRVIYEKTADRFFITETRVRVIIANHRGRKKLNRREQKKD